MWALFITVHLWHFLWPCTLQCARSNRWPCPRCTLRPLDFLSTVCLQKLLQMGSALWYFDLTRSGSKVRQGWGWGGIPWVPFWSTSFAIYCSAGQRPKVSGKLKSFQVPFVICNNVPQGASDDRCEFLLHSRQIEATGNRFERIPI